MRTLIASLVAFLMAAAPAAAANKTYSAERFDSRIRILPSGSIEVVETVVFRFEGEFTHVFRELPTRRTEGIDIVSAQMDGQTLPFGKGPGQVEVRRQSKVRVEWRFAPRTDSTHTFVLTYVVNGVVQRQNGRDVLDWVALPAEHDYRIDQSEVLLELPTAPVVRPAVHTRRVAEMTLEPGSQRVQILASGISKNGWLSARLEFDEGAIIAAAPAWQQRQLAARALAPRWMIAAGLVFAVGLLLMVALRQRYDSPQGTGSSGGTVETPPDTLRPAVAGAVASHGGVALQHAMATLFALADRGAVTITEEPRKWGQRHFTLHRRQTNQPLAPEEVAVLNLAFRHKGKEESAVSLTQARGRVGGRLGDFKVAVKQELRALGMLDEERMLVRARYLGFSIGFVCLAALLIIPAIFLTGRYEGWPFLIAAAVAAVAVVGFIFYGTLTPLSNEGLRRSERWLGYQKHLKAVARERAHLMSTSPAGLLPFAVALGLAGAWSKYLKKHPAGVPPWFRAARSLGRRWRVPGVHRDERSQRGRRRGRRWRGWWRRRGFVGRRLTLMFAHTNGTRISRISHINGTRIPRISYINGTRIPRISRISGTPAWPAFKLAVRSVRDAPASDVGEPAP